MATLSRSFRVKIWDLPTRLFHWLLAALWLFSWLTAQWGIEYIHYHALSGYAILALVNFRLVWGLVGSATARFSHFLYGLSALWRYLKRLPTRQPSFWLGHNPIGGLAVVALLLATLVQAATGLFASDDIFFDGPLHDWVSSDLADTLTTLHHLNFNLLLGLIAIHIVAVLYYRFVKGEDLITPMITGVKRLPRAHAPPAIVHWGWALLAALACAGLVALVVNGDQLLP